VQIVIKLSERESGGIMMILYAHDLFQKTLGVLIIKTSTTFAECQD